MVRRLIRIYTPFVCALVALAHGVLSLTGYEGLAYYVFSELAGHSILLLVYMLATSSPKINIWYKRSIYLLMSIHALNLLFIAGYAPYYAVIYAGIVLNIASIVAFLVYRAYVGFTNVLRLYGTRSEERE